MEATWRRVQAEVRRAEVAAAVAAAPETMRHLSGVHLASQVMIRRRLAFVVVPATGDPVVLVQAVHEDTMRSRGSIPEVAAYVTGPIKGLTGLLCDMGLDKSALLVELDYLPAADARELTEALPGAQIKDAGDFFRAVREVRLAPEIEAHERCAKAAEQATQVAFSLATGGGVTEHQVFTRMQEALLSLGGGIIPFLTLSSGSERTYQTHAHPSDRVIRRGDFLLVDMVGFFSGLYTDMARTVVVGEATPEQRQIYRRVRDVQQEVIGSLRPGTTAGEAYERYLRSVRIHGVTYTYRYVGHSTGYQVVEEPVMTAGSQALLRPGMVLCVEVKDRVEGVGAVQLEEMLLLTESGPRIWTDLMAADELPEIR